MLDPSTLVIIVILIGIGMLALLGVASPKPPSAQTPVDMALLIMRLDLELSSMESQLRFRQLHHEAEGARQIRAKAREFLEGYRP
jgi:hypothetical protein